MLVAPLLFWFAASSTQEDHLLAPADVVALERIVRPDAGEFLGWIDDRHYVLRATDAGSDQRAYFAVDAEVGSRRRLFDPGALSRALGALPGIPPELAREASRGEVRFTSDWTAVVVPMASDLFFWRIGEDRAVRLTGDAGEEVGWDPAPDGSMVAFLRDFDLHVAAADGSAVRALTEGGHENLLRGRLDWVYQEELYGRGNWKGFFWSPDSKCLAFLELDESAVPPYTIVDHRSRRPSVEVWRYPKAGDPNPTARVGIVDAAGGPVRYADLERYAHEPFLIVRVGWTPDARQVVVQVQNRIQTWLDLLLVDRDTGESRRLFCERTGVWVEPTDAPHWFSDGSRFVWLSERDGFRHMYLYRRDGTLECRLTQGPWEVDEVERIDERRGWVYFTGDRDDARGAKLMRVRLDGSGLETITREAGTHAVEVSPGCEWIRDEWSSLEDPGHVSIRDASGGIVRVEARANVEALSRFGLTPPVRLDVPLEDGFALPAILFRPKDFDPGRRYPVLCHVYGGPHAPQARDRFFNRHALFHHMLAQRGYLVWVCDNRSASGKGLESVKGIYRNLCEQELRDQLEALDWLLSRGYADPERIGIWGWSYGGTMTAYAMTRSERFRMGIAGAPVTDWRLYDSIYTERYMDTPQANPEGYARSSIVRAAADLHGRLLIIHGTVDENVHIQNTFQLVEALQRAGKRFDLMVYPGNRHWIADREQQVHLYATLLDYVLERL